MEWLSLNGSFFCLLLVRGDFTTLWLSISAVVGICRVTISSWLSHLACRFVLLRFGPPHPKKGWEGGPKRSVGCKTGGKFCIFFDPPRPHPWDENGNGQNINWNGIVNMECLHRLRLEKPCKRNYNRKRNRKVCWNKVGSSKTRLLISKDPCCITKNTWEKNQIKDLIYFNFFKDDALTSWQHSSFFFSSLILSNFISDFPTYASHVSFWVTISCRTVMAYPL